MANTKRFGLPADQIREVAPGHGGCMATDMITVHGKRVGYMYRGVPRDRWDSGWVFTEGMESLSFMDDAKNHGIYDVNTIANYDPEIVPLLDTPAPCAFERRGGKFVKAPIPPVE